MKIEGNIRVLKSSAGTEVFITSKDPYINTVMHLPADAEITDGDTIEIVQLPSSEAQTEADVS